MRNQQEETPTARATGTQPALATDQKSPHEPRTTARIGTSVTIKGDVIGAEDLTIDGQVEGTIALGDHTLTVGVGAAIRAELKARAVVISGAITGNVTATERIEIRETGSVNGDITAPRLSVREGAVLGGRVATGAAAQDNEARHFPKAV